MKKNLFSISMITLVSMYALLSIILIGICLIAKIPVTYGILTSIIVIILQFLLAPFFTDLTVKWFYKANFDAEIPLYLREFIERICQKENIKFPKLAIIDDSAPNAFTYGRFKNDARLVITRGIFELLNEEEVKSVVGHELGHIVHLDMFLMTAVELVPLVLYYIYQGLIKSDNDNDNNYSQLIAIIAYVLYIITQYIVLWFSRTREYYADEYSIKNTRNPNALANSLVKIGFGLILRDNSNNPDNNENDKKKKKKYSINEIGALGLFDSKTSKSLIVTSNGNFNDKMSIKNAMKWEMWNPWAFIYELKSTHPLISKRLLAISNYSREYNQEPYVVFDLKKEESYVDDFFLELFIKYLPIISFLITLVLLICLLIRNVSFNASLIIGIGGLITVISSFVAFSRSHRSGYENRTVRDLLGEVKVSGITSIPCIVEGRIIGKGDPGCVFSEDFVLQDNTGIIFLDYNQPLFIINKIFALFKSHQYINEIVKIKGWYRRSPVPYIEIYEMEILGKTKKVFTYNLGIILHILFGIVSLIILFL